MSDSTAFPQSVRRVWPHLTLLGLLLLAFALRVYHLPDQSLWYDEGVSWYMTRMSLPSLTVWTANDIQPPLYYYLLWLWVRLAGTSEYALRFPSVFFGVLTVPLLWITARRLLGSPAAWLAALFLILSPLHVYYAQEARMYTLLTFLGLLSSYLLLRLVSGGRGSLPSSYRGEGPGMGVAYVLTAVAALYTHYFAFFLLAAHALYVFYWWWKGYNTPSPSQGEGRGGGWIRSIAIPISIFLLYLPWLPFLLTRYGLDTSYWAGPLKLDEVARKLFVAFSLGETVKERVGLQLGIGYGVILLVSLVALWQGTRQSNYAVRNTQYVIRNTYCVLRKDSLVFLLLYLAIPVALVLLLAYRTPKFNPRYAMLSSPAFILLIAGGISVLIKPPLSRFPFHASRFISRLPSTVYCLLAAGFILATSAYSLRNWFTPFPVNQFDKADFRITARTVRAWVRPDQAVLLSSGHMFPAWAYYYGWEGWQRVPDTEILDVNTTLDLSVGDELDRLLRGRRGVWLVRWQNEVTDPFDVLPLYLGTVGTQGYYHHFWHMELIHYRLPPNARFDAASFISQPADADFGGEVKLLGLRQTPGTGLVLFWQALAPVNTDYTVFVHLLDADGKTLVNADHLPPHPTHVWRPGQIVPDRVTLQLPPDLPAGDYRIEVGLYNAADPALPRLSLADGSGDRVILPLHYPSPAGNGAGPASEGNDLE